MELNVVTSLQLFPKCYAGSAEHFYLRFQIEFKSFPFFCEFEFERKKKKKLYVGCTRPIYHKILSVAAGPFHFVFVKALTVKYICGS